MRALWACVVVCLMAAHAVPSARAASGETVERVQRVDHPGLPAVATARSPGALIATRASGLTWTIAAAPPALPRIDRIQIVEAPARAPHPAVGVMTIRSARGPPGR